MHVRLVPLDGGPPIELVKDMTVVGRSADCDVRIDHKSVSKLHCVLALSDGLVMVRDLGSTNGTRVNGQRVRRAALLPNDHFAVANFRYRLKAGADTVEDPPLSTDSVVHAPDAKDDDDTPPSEAIKVADPGTRRNDLPDFYPTDPPKKG